MKRIILTAILLILLISCEARVLAQVADLPSPGILPDSNFYFLKSWKESIQTFFTFGAENKAKQYLHLADVRLAEYQKMIEQNKTDIALKTLEKYGKQLNQAMAKIKEAEAKGAIAELDTIMREKRLKQQKTIEGISEKMSETTKKRIAEERQKQWTDFLLGVKEKFPEAIPGSAEAGDLPVQLLLNCPLPAIPSPEACSGKWLISLVQDCPYFHCPSVGKTQAAPLIVKPAEPGVCIQVITPAVDPITGKCKEFGTPCEVPADWKKVDKCPASIQPKSIQPTQSKSISSPTPNTSLPLVTGTLQLEFPSIFLAGQPIMMRSPGSPMPQPVAEQRPTLQSIDDDQWCAKKRMRVDDYGVKYILEMLGVETVKVGSVHCRACHIRKFSEGGVLAAERWDDMYLWYLQKLSGKWACEKSINYKNFIGDEWTDYYQISESWSPQNFYYQCVKREGTYVSGNADFCEKDVPATAILPSPTVTPQTSTPTEPLSYISCTKGGMKEHACSDGTMVRWQCQCFSHNVSISSADYHYDCDLEPAKYCPASNVSAPLTVTWINVRLQEGAKSPSIFWKTNQSALSYIEHGPTTSYGFRDSKLPNTSDTNFVVWSLTQDGTSIESKLQPDTLYHFRIVADDTKGNTFVSQDYTFTTGL